MGCGEFPVTTSNEDQTMASSRMRAAPAPLMPGCSTERNEEENIAELE